MHSHWRSLHDPEMRRSYAVSPLTGHLLSSVDGQALQLPRSLGFAAARRMPDIFFKRGPIVDCLPVAVAPSYGDRAMLMSVRAALRCLPLGAAIGVLDLVAGRLGSAPASTEAAIEATARTFGHRSRDDCLEMSICRYLMLKRFGCRVEVNVGVFVPTAKMHAWVEVDGQPILECEDVLAHYQSCLTFGAKASQI